MEIWGYGFFTFCLLAYWTWIGLIIFLAVFGLTGGVRKTFVKIMLYVFEACRRKIYLTELDVYNREGRTDKLVAEEAIVDREVIISPGGVTVRSSNIDSRKHEFRLADVGVFIKNGVEAIVADDVTSRFQAAEIPAWNLLSRNAILPQFISWRMKVVWYLGFVLRYFILFPFRFSLFLVALSMGVGGNVFIGVCIPLPRVRRFVYRYLNLATSRVFMRSFSAVLTFHNRENRAEGGGICVANHTSPIDILLLGTDNVYALVGQKQGGLLGLVQWAYNRAESHVWFNRSEAGDRQAVSRRLREHVADKNKLPILIFPEGTCINNTSIMMFKKGSFETGGVIYPAVIKYDARFSDAFWNSSKYPMVQYMLMLMTSWALVADITYLPPQTIQPGENGIAFASRVKADIARAGGLVDLDWDGMLKRTNPKPAMKEKTQEAYSEVIKKED